VGISMAGLLVLRQCRCTPSMAFEARGTTCEECYASAKPCRLVAGSEPKCDVATHASLIRQGRYLAQSKYF